MKNYQVVRTIEKNQGSSVTGIIRGFDTGKRVLTRIQGNLNRKGWQTIQSTPRKVILQSPKTGTKHTLTLETR